MAKTLKTIKYEGAFRYGLMQNEFTRYRDGKVWDGKCGEKDGL